MAIDRPEPYDTLYPTGPATARNQRIEITRLTEILEKITAISSTSSSSSVSEAQIAFESEITRRLVEELLLLVGSKLDINLVGLVKAITGSSEYTITDIITTLNDLSVSITGTVDVNVVSSTLPTNAAQETGGNLDSINTKLDTLETTLETISETVATEETLQNLYSEDIDIRRLAELTLLQQNVAVVNSLVVADRGNSTRFVEIR